MEQNTSGESVLSAFESAWDQLWDEVKAHPCILRYRETHVHVLLGHYLLCKLESKPQLNRYSHCDVWFDENAAIRVSGTLSFVLFGVRARPDIVVRRKLPGGGGDGIAVELKVVRTTLDSVEADDEQITRKHNYLQELSGVCDDIEYLHEYATLGWERDKLQAEMCVLHLHDPRFGAIPRALEKIQWCDTYESKSPQLIVRRAVGAVTPAPVFDPVDANLGFTRPQTRWRQARA